MLWFLAPPTVIKLVRDISIYQAIGESVSAALPRLHAYTGCYTVSAFAGNPALQIPKSKGEYRTAFSRFCRDMENSPDILEML